MTTVEYRPLLTVRQQVVTLTVLGVPGAVCFLLIVLIVVDVIDYPYGDTSFFFLKLGAMMGVGFLGLAWVMRSLMDRTGVVRLSVLDDRLEIDAKDMSDGEPMRVDYASLESVELQTTGLSNGEKPHWLYFYAAEDQALGIMSVSSWRRKPNGDWSRQLLAHLDEHQVSMDDSVRRLLDHDLVQRSLR